MNKMTNINSFASRAVHLRNAANSFGILSDALGVVGVARALQKRTQLLRRLNTALQRTRDIKVSRVKGL